MSKAAVITKYEYKMQIGRIAAWIVWLFVASVSMADCLPTASNRARLEFLGDIRYFVWRVFSIDGLILLFGILFLTAGRLTEDQKSGRRDLFMAAPVGKMSYLAGKLSGNILFALTLMYSLLGISLFGFAVTSPAEAAFADYIGVVFSVSVFIVLPATFFVVAGGIMLSELVDLRLVYLLYSVLFLVNAFSVHTAEARPFYILTQGDLARAVWQHPKYPEIHVGSACVNLAFMLGTGGMAILLVAADRRFWRAE
ncbi:MAG: hypothetical protein NC541_14880 [bacterium]|nr:hypothetical protein [bacterium]